MLISNRTAASTYVVESWWCRFRVSSKYSMLTRSVLKREVLIKWRGTRKLTRLSWALTLGAVLENSSIMLDRNISNVRTGVVRLDVVCSDRCDRNRCRFLPTSRKTYVISSGSIMQTR